MQYIIIGDSPVYTDTLIAVCYGGRDVAEDKLKEFVNDPYYSNVHIAEVEEKDCWWLDPFLAN